MSQQPPSSPSPSVGEGHSAAVPIPRGNHRVALSMVPALLSTPTTRHLQQDGTTINTAHNSTNNSGVNGSPPINGFDRSATVQLNHRSRYNRQSSVDWEEGGAMARINRSVTSYPAHPGGNEGTSTAYPLSDDDGDIEGTEVPLFINTAYDTAPHQPTSSAMATAAASAATAGASSTARPANSGLSSPTHSPNHSPARSNPALSLGTPRRTNSFNQQMSGMTIEEDMDGEDEQLPSSASSLHLTQQSPKRQLSFQIAFTPDSTSVETSPPVSLVHALTKAKSETLSGTITQQIHPRQPSAPFHLTAGTVSIQPEHVQLVFPGAATLQQQQQPAPIDVGSNGRSSVNSSSPTLDGSMSALSLRLETDGSSAPTTGTTSPTLRDRLSRAELSRPHTVSHASLASRGFGYGPSNRTGTTTSVRVTPVPSPTAVTSAAGDLASPPHTPATGTSSDVTSPTTSEGGAVVAPLALRLYHSVSPPHVSPPSATSTGSHSRHVSFPNLSPAQQHALSRNGNTTTSGAGGGTLSVLTDATATGNQQWAYRSATGHASSSPTSAHQRTDSMTSEYSSYDDVPPSSNTASVTRHPTPLRGVARLVRLIRTHIIAPHALLRHSGHSGGVGGSHTTTTTGARWSSTTIVRKFLAHTENGGYGKEFDIPSMLAAQFGLEEFRQRMAARLHHLDSAQTVTATTELMVGMFASLRTFHRLLDGTSVLNAHLSKRQALQSILSSVEQLLDAEKVTIFLLHERGGQQMLKAVCAVKIPSRNGSNSMETVLRPAEFTVASELVSIVARTGELRNVRNCASEPLCWINGAANYSNGFTATSGSAVPGASLSSTYSHSGSSELAQTLSISPMSPSPSLCNTMPLHSLIPDMTPMTPSIGLSHPFTPTTHHSAGNMIEPFSSTMPLLSGIGSLRPVPSKPQQTTNDWNSVALATPMVVGNSPLSASPQLQHTPIRSPALFAGGASTSPLQSPATAPITTAPALEVTDRVGSPQSDGIISPAPNSHHPNVSVTVPSPLSVSALTSPPSNGGATSGNGSSAMQTAAARLSNLAMPSSPPVPGSTGGIGGVGGAQPFLTPQHVPGVSRDYSSAIMAAAIPHSGAATTRSSESGYSHGLGSAGTLGSGKAHLFDRSLSASPAQPPFHLRNCLCVPVRGNTVGSTAAPRDSTGKKEQGKVVAVIQMLNKRSGPFFTPEDVQIMQFIGLLAGQSLSNAQLYEEACLRRRQQEALCTMIELISAQTGLDEVIERIIDAAYSLLEVDRISLYIVDEVRGQLLCKVSKDPNAIGQRLPIRWGLLGRVAAEGKISNISDAAHDPEFDKTLDKVTGYTTRNILTLPIQDNSNKTAAVIQITNKRKGDFTREDEGLMMTLARSAGQILRKAQLFSALLVEQRKTKALMAILQAEESEVSIENLLERILQTAFDVLPCMKVALYFVDNVREDLYALVADAPIPPPKPMNESSSTTGEKLDSSTTASPIQSPPGTATSPEPSNVIRADSSPATAVSLSTVPSSSSPVGATSTPVGASDTESVSASAVSALIATRTPIRGSTEGGLSSASKLATKRGNLLASHKSTAAAHAAANSATSGNISGNIGGSGKPNIPSTMHLSFPLRKGFAGWVADQGVGLNLPSSASTDSRFDPLFDRTVSAAATAAGDKARARTNFKTRSTLAIPLHNATGTTIAVFQAINRFKPQQPKATSISAADSSTPISPGTSPLEGGSNEKSSRVNVSLAGITTPGEASLLNSESQLNSLIVPFSEEDEEIFRALCTQAGITLRRRLTEVLLGRSRRELGDDKNLGGLFEIYGGNYLSGNSGVVASGVMGTSATGHGGSVLVGGQSDGGSGGSGSSGHSHSSSLIMGTGGGGVHSARHSMSTPSGSSLSHSFSSVALAALAATSSAGPSPSVSKSGSLARSGSTDFNVLSPTPGRNSMAPSSTSRQQSIRRRTVAESPNRSVTATAPPMHPNHPSPATSTAKVAAMLLGAASTPSSTLTPTRGQHVRGPSATPGALISSLPTIPSSPSPSPSPALSSVTSKSGDSSEAKPVGTPPSPAAFDLTVQPLTSIIPLPSPALVNSTTSISSNDSVPTVVRQRSAVTALSATSRRAREPSDDAMAKAAADESVDLIPSKLTPAARSVVISVTESEVKAPCTHPHQSALSIVSAATSTPPRAAHAAPMLLEEPATDASESGSVSPITPTSLLPAVVGQSHGSGARAIVGFVQHSDEMSLTRRRLGAGGGPSFSSADSKSVVTNGEDDHHHDTVGSADSYFWPLLPEKLLSSLNISTLHEMDTFDVFSYSEDQLIHFTLLMLEDLGLLTDFNLRLPKLQSFLVAVRWHYNSNPYHNWSVEQTLGTFFMGS
jgi:GAF domain-containing protein